MTHGSVRRPPFAKVGDISRAASNDAATIASAANFLSRSDARAIKATPVPQGSVLFAKIGEAIALNRRVLAGREMLIDNNAMALVPLAVEPEFLLLLMRSIDLYPLAAATTVPSLRKTEIEAIPVPVPPPAERDLIARRASAALGQQARLRNDAVALTASTLALDARVLAAAFRGELMDRQSDGSSHDT